MQKHNITLNKTDLLFGKFLLYIYVIRFTPREELLHLLISVISGAFPNISWIMLLPILCISFKQEVWIIQ